jgi:ParB-like chromosome segregation protein Spo0J
MKTQTVPINEVKSNPNNPRIIKDDKFKKLVASIKELPQMLQLRPIVVNEDMVVLGGNMRLKACKEAGLKEIPIIKASELNEEQQRAFIIKDNVGFGEWDWDMLADEWDYKDLQEWGLDIPGVSLDDDFNVSDEYNYQNKVTVQFKTLEEATSYHEKCIQENLKAQLS